MFTRLLLWLYKFNNFYTRHVIMSVISRHEGGVTHSKTLRMIYKQYYGIEIGMYTHGGCFDLFMVDPHTSIGRYCSIAKGVRILNVNHPIHFKGTSALFFNPAFGYCDDWLVGFASTEIGNDVWIGANAVILPEVKRVGDGAVIGAGAVVNRDVPPFAVVLGNPGRVVKYRFSEATIRTLLEEKWWERDIDDLGTELKSFQQPLEQESTAQ